MKFVARALAIGLIWIAFAPEHTGTTMRPVTRAIPAPPEAPANPAVPTASPSAGTETIWLSPHGSDSANGTRAHPLRTLGGASRLLCSLRPHCGSLGKPVEVRLEAGIYTGATSVWQYSDPSLPTRIVPAGWKPGWTYSDVKAAGGLPVMDGENAASWGLDIEPKRTGPTNISIFFIRWQRFTAGAIVQSGGGSDLFYANEFTRIGQYFTKSQQWGYAGVMLKGVTGSTVANSSFTDILNVGDSYTHEHGVYLIRSSHNLVVGNNFTNVGGDPIRIRDSANYNLIVNNTFTRTGSASYIGDWQCLTAIHPDCPTGDEKISWHNAFTGNTLMGAHPWHWYRFMPVYCYDLDAPCPSQRIRQ